MVQTDFRLVAIEILRIQNCVCHHRDILLLGLGYKLFKFWDLKYGKGYGVNSVSRHAGNGPIALVINNLSNPGRRV